MSDAITIHNGGEAPQAAKAVTGVAVVRQAQEGSMQQNGGQAPEAGGGSQEAGLVQPVSGSDAAGAAPLGGGVHAL